MEWLYWGIVVLCIIVSFVGLIYPIIPSVVFLVAGFILYGVFFSFEPFNWLFWLIQGMFVLLLFGADYVANTIGLKRFGATKAGIIGSTVGILIGPFIIPIFGILIGPFIGAVLGELIVHRTSIKSAMKVGIGSLVGFISSVITKGTLQVIMVSYFLWLVLN
ncbi:DUF456 domain-containing protein [Bacillus sp. 2205SS5-2]|uniref:DUF456 domain-containing protein n=1 Tax=Bacillus sp. 2205SS5-2 TaxID=3109031 RepID=UPI00300538D2